MIQSFFNDEWARIPPKVCANMAANYKKSLTIVLASKGIFTKYSAMFCLGIKYLFHMVRCRSVHNFGFGFLVVILCLYQNETTIKKRDCWFLWKWANFQIQLEVEIFVSSTVKLHVQNHLSNQIESFQTLSPSLLFQNSPMVLNSALPECHVSLSHNALSHVNEVILSCDITGKHQWVLGTHSSVITLSLWPI